MTKDKANPGAQAGGGSSPAGDDDLLAKVAKAQADDGKASDLQKQIDELTAQVAKLTDVASRAQAELQNAKIRMDREGSEIRRFAAEASLLKLLPVIDNFQRAFKVLPDDLKAHDWVKGVAAIEQSFIRQVTDMGLQKFDSVGQPVDTARHEVLMEGPGGRGIVTEVFEDGYELNGKVIRPAKVKVGDGQGAKVS